MWKEISHRDYLLKRARCNGYLNVDGAHIWYLPAGRAYLKAGPCDTFYQWFDETEAVMAGDYSGRSKLPDLLNWAFQDWIPENK